MDHMSWNTRKYGPSYCDLIFLWIAGWNVIYQALDAVFHHRTKHWEKSWTYDAQRSIFDEFRGVSSGYETLCKMLDIITSQTKLI